MPDFPDTRMSNDGDPVLTALLVDQQSRWQQGRGVFVEVYLDQQPRLRGDDEAMLQLILHEVLLRREHGDRFEMAEYQRRFPHLADQLAVQFEVERAIAGETMLSGTLPQAMIGTPTGPWNVPPELSPQPSVPGYQILRVLGQGAMGIVYQARQLKLDRIVALKMIRDPSAVFPGQHSALLERLRSEAEALARLQHPDIVGIFELGESNGLPYLALEYVAGGSLAARLTGAAQPAKQAAALVERLARAMHAAHECGVLHRDLKPANILLTLDGSPKISDFGLAKRLDEEASQTATGMLLGTPSYMSPEQAEGKNKEVGVAADVYTLGAVLYELLTGRPPFRAATLMGTLLKVKTEEPVPPRQRNPAVPRNLETICLKCLEKAPARRYPSAAALADELVRFLEQRPIQARPAGMFERAAKWARRRPTAATLLAVSVLALLGLGVLSAVAIGQRHAAVAALEGQVQARLKEEQERSRRALAQVETLLSAEPHDLPRLLDVLAEQREDVLPRLRQVWDEPDTPSNRRSRMRAGLALLPVEPERVRDALVRWLLEVPDPAELLVVRDALRPHAAALREELWRRFESAGMAAAQRLRLLAALAAFDPQGARWKQVAGPTLVELIVEADDRQFATLLPVLQPYCERALPLLRREVETPARPGWHDPPAASWPVPAADLRYQIEQADGLLAERFALVQTLPLERFAALAEGMRHGGYRPTCCRPYRADRGTCVAAVWTRDGRDWRLLHSVSAEQVRRQDEKLRQEGYEPIDVTVWLAPGEPVKECCAALWVRAKNQAGQARLYVGVPEERHWQDGWGPPQQAGLQPLTAHSLHGADGIRRYSGTWGRFPGSLTWTTPNYWIDELDYQRRLTPDRTQVNVEVRPTPRQTPQEYQRAELARYSAAVQFTPSNLEARFQRGLAYSRLGDDRRALQDLDDHLKAEQRYWMPFIERAFVLARMGRAEDAHKDLLEFRNRVPASDKVVPIEALLAVYLGQDVAWPALTELVRSNRNNPGVLYDVAVVHAQAAHWLRIRHLAAAAALVGRPNSLVAAATGSIRRPELWREHRDRAAALLEQSVAAGLLRCWEIRTDLRLAPLHDHPGYQALVKRFHPDREYSAVWHTNPVRESVESHGLAPAAHLARCRELLAQGYRPVALSVAETAPGRPVTTASVWQRPAIGERALMFHARRQAAAGLALLKLGRAEPIWPLLKHSAYPEARSRLALRLGPAGIDAHVVIERLHAEQDVSIRRALILALGGYSAAGMPLELRQQLVPRLLRWYRDDPDPGIHGAIDWLLRNSWEGPERRPLDWGQAKELERIDKELASRVALAPGGQLASRVALAPGGHRWYVNGQQQTFVVVDGNAPFLMGSPSDEVGHRDDEKLHWRRIGRRYAVATTPVTVAEFERFLKTHPEVKHSYGKNVSPTSDCPIVNVTWYLAAQYCRWLSEQEAVSQEQMVYPPVAEIEKCKDGKTALLLPANHLKRTGYRLPTEAEWEHACRAGSRTSNYFGSSGELLPHYAWYGANSRDRTWPVGQKRPNDLGLFDMHGNVWNWCQEHAGPYPPGTPDSPAPDEEDGKDISDLPERLLRGTSFVIHPLNMRSAYRLDRIRPGDSMAGYGIRVARTMP